MSENVLYVRVSLPVISFSAHWLEVLINKSCVFHLEKVENISGMKVFNSDSGSGLLWWCRLRRRGVVPSTFRRVSVLLDACVWTPACMQDIWWQQQTSSIINPLNFTPVWRGHTSHMTKHKS